MKTLIESLNLFDRIGEFLHRVGQFYEHLRRVFFARCAAVAGLREELQREMDVPSLGNSGFELAELRDYVGAKFNSETPNSSALSKLT